MPARVPSVKEKAFDHAAFEERLRTRDRELRNQASEVRPDTNQLFAEAAMPRTAAKEMPQRVNDKSFDHAAFEAARPMQRGYDLTRLSEEVPPLQESYQPYSAGAFGCPIDGEDACFDAPASSYSDLRRAYCPDMQHYSQPVVEKTLDQLLAERAQGGKVLPASGAQSRAQRDEQY